MGKADAGSAHRNKKTICLPFSQENYESHVIDPTDFRRCIDERIDLFPELFPAGIAEGYRMKDMCWSKKQGILTRRIEIAGTAYTIRPSFALPYMSGLVDEVEKAIFLRKFSVPFWGLSHVFGKYPMYWYRVEKSLGRNSIVGTTVRKAEDIPQHLAADEKHTRVLGDKVYVATTVGKGCILGACIAKDAGEDALKDAYRVFKDEARCLKPDYEAETVNTDGWRATRKAWSYLFGSAVILCCFLHVFIKIRDRAKKKYKDIFLCVSSKLWDCYRAETKGQFSQRVRRVVEWCRKESVPSVILNPIGKLRKNIKAYSVAYDYPEAHRTSNMLDRLMQRMDRHLFNTKYFHGNLSEAELSIRGWTLIQNFAPSNPQTVKIHDGYLSPAERLNRFRYHKNWLQNLLISASLGGYRAPPQNPLL
jgi:hypothetical protein